MEPSEQSEAQGATSDAALLVALAETGGQSSHEAQQVAAGAGAIVESGELGSSSGPASRGAAGDQEPRLKTPRWVRSRILHEEPAPSFLFIGVCRWRSGQSRELSSNLFSLDIAQL